MNKETDLTKLKKGDIIKTKVSRELSDSLRYLLFEYDSYQNLFNNYLSSEIEFTNKFNLDLFLEKQFKLSQNIEYLKSEIVKISLGEKYNYIKKYEYYYTIDPDHNTLTIKIKGEVHYEK